jgi:hypothetical protein
MIVGGNNVFSIKLNKIVAQSNLLFIKVTLPFWGVCFRLLEDGKFAIRVVKTPKDTEAKSSRTYD